MMPARAGEAVDAAGVTLPLIVGRQQMPDRAALAGFRRPLVLFLAHQEDPTHMLPTFVVLDFERREFVILRSYSEANSKELQRCIEFVGVRGTLPHSVVTSRVGESFLAFTFGEGDCSWFYEVDYVRDRMKILPANVFLSGTGQVHAIGSTLFRDPADSRFFFAPLKIEEGGEWRIEYVRAAAQPALPGPVALFARAACSTGDCPHAMRRFGDLLLSSEFSADEFRIHRTGERFEGLVALVRYVQSRGSWKWLRLLRAEDVACNSAQVTRFLEQCQASDEFRFELTPGRIRLLSLGELREQEVPVTCPKPAHFEPGANGHVYLSCHNLFCVEETNYFVGPGAIIKMCLTSDRIVERGVFRDLWGFRFASHAVFRRDSKEYLCTFGYPNRLFVVDCESMTAVAWRDMGVSCLPREAPPYMIGLPEFESHAIKAIAADETGQHVIFPSHTDLCIASTDILEIVYRIDIAGIVSACVRCNTSGILNRSLHFGFL